MRIDKKMRRMAFPSFAASQEEGHDGSTQESIIRPLPLPRIKNNFASAASTESDEIVFGRTQSLFRPPKLKVLKLTRSSSDKSDEKEPARASGNDSNEDDSSGDSFSTQPIVLPPALRMLSIPSLAATPLSQLPEPPPRKTSQDMLLNRAGSRPMYGTQESATILAEFRPLSQSFAVQLLIDGNSASSGEVAESPRLVRPKPFKTLKMNNSPDAKDVEEHISTEAPVTMAIEPSCYNEEDQHYHYEYEEPYVEPTLFEGEKIYENKYHQTRAVDPQTDENYAQALPLSGLLKQKNSGRADYTRLNPGGSESDDLTKSRRFAPRIPHFEESANCSTSTLNSTTKSRNAIQHSMKFNDDGWPEEADQPIDKETRGMAKPSSQRNYSERVNSAAAIGLRAAPTLKEKFSAVQKTTAQAAKKKQPKGPPRQVSMLTFVAKPRSSTVRSEEKWLPRLKKD